MCQTIFVHPPGLLKLIRPLSNDLTIWLGAMAPAVPHPANMAVSKSLHELPRNEGKEAGAKNSQNRFKFLFGTKSHRITNERRW